MATATASERRPRTSTLPRPRPPATPRRAPTSRDARADEITARRALARSFARMERAHAVAARDLNRFEAYFDEVRKRLRSAGYLAALPRPR